MNEDSQRADGPSGLLPCQALDALIAARHIAADAPITAEQVQPASLDLRLGGHAWRVRASFLPGERLTVEDGLKRFGLHRIDLSGGAVLETGCVYVVPLVEMLNLPSNVSASANPKSSTGRIDVFTRIIADRTRAFDQIPAGYAGPLYAEICPQTFPVLVRTGSRLAQMRFRRGLSETSDSALAALHEQEQLVSTSADIDRGLALSVDLAGEEPGAVIGYRAKRYTGVVDIDEAGACPVEDYWEPLRAGREPELVLDPDQFYILASKEAVHVPPTHAAEMIPFNPLVGEFRVHYAGFFDPGFGHDAAGGAGSRVVLEVRSHKVPFMLEDGQIVGRAVYEHLTEVPTRLYGQGIGSHYQAQRLKLSKHFR